MKVALLIVESEASPEFSSEAEREFQTLAPWWAELRKAVRVVASGKLAPSRTAHTVSWHDSQPVVTDGPYLEAKESVGGLLIVDVDSEAEAIELARRWPNKVGCRIEVRRFEGWLKDGGR
jgi:hypothetical protein